MSKIASVSWHVEVGEVDFNNFIANITKTLLGEDYV
jgi:hypothetical protein